jgi:glutathione S-transferase
MTTTLYVGNRNYSSWSLRPWLALRWAGLAFDTVEVRLDQPGYGVQGIEQVLRLAPHGRLPVLHVDGQVIWDSLAISEWVAEATPGRGVWPADACLRAEARSVTAEMHSGFSALRTELPMNILGRKCAQAWSAAALGEIARVQAIWSGLRTRHHAAGSFLFGERGIADAFYAPVAARLRTYGVKIEPVAQSWCDTVFNDPDFQLWESMCQPDSWDSSGYSVIDRLYD